MNIRKLPASAKIDEVCAVLKEDGGVIIQNFVSPELLVALREELLPLLEKTPKGKDAYFAGTQTRRVSRLFARTKHVAEVALNPVFLESARAIIGKPIKVWSGEQQHEIVPDVQVGVTQAIQIHPGQGQQPLHRDDTVWLWRHPQFGREARVQIMVAISEFTAENGATMVIPGSHKWDDERMPRQEEAVPAEMAAGDALIFIGSTYHGGGKNQSDGPRTGLTMSYDLAILRQEENHFLSIPIEKIRTYPPELQSLLGWSVSATYLGFVERDGVMVNPQDLLQMDSFVEVGKFD
jgi:ectoine hydroxylase-related dioxygenase (phytanoyl-CoA dioxygenase family)